MFRARLRPIAFTVALLFAGPALASEPSVEIVGERIELGDLNPTVPRELLHLDVGPAPLPGHARVVSREAIRAALARAGADARVGAPPERRQGPGGGARQDRPRAGGAHGERAFTAAVAAQGGCPRCGG